MANARKEGKKKKSRKSVIKTLKMINKNEELIGKYMAELKSKV
jgi:hypothetical protein